MDHAIVLEFKETASRGRKYHDRLAGMPIGKQFHVAAQAGAVPVVIIASHSGYSIVADEEVPSPKVLMRLETSFKPALPRLE
jgi:hypothetical protein